MPGRDEGHKSHRPQLPATAVSALSRAAARERGRVPASPGESAGSSGSMWSSVCCSASGPQHASGCAAAHRSATICSGRDL
jgi:hypothetical protein